MSNTPNYNAKVKAILEATTPGERVCALTGEKWMLTDEEIGWLKKFQVPPHPWAPIMRLKQMMGFPTGIAIWRKPHADTGEPILSFVHPDNPFKVITDKEWFARDFAQSTKELDPDRPVFPQLQALAQATPVGALRDDGSNINCVGVDIIDGQDCYMFFGGYGNKRSMYGAVSYESEDACLLTNTKGIQRSYMINACSDLHGCRYCFQNGKLINCTFCFDCDNLEFCFGASNQSHKKYLFWNEQLTKEEWERRVSEVDLSDRGVWEAQVRRFHQMVCEEAYWRADFNLEPLEDSTGEYLLNSTRLHDCYWQDGGTDLYRSWIGVESRESAFVVWSGWGDAAYMCTDILKHHNIKMCMRVWRSQNLEYCIDCFDCEDCFGCVGLQRKSFCIYNKQYSEADYWQRVDALKCAMLDRGEYGQFFPAQFSQVGYAYSMGELYLGYTPEELSLFGALEFDSTKGNVHTVDGTLKVTDLPDRLIDTIPEQHVGKPILDTALGRPFTITPTEFAFYQSHGLPLPREHFLSRMTTLFRHANGPIPEQAPCAKCGTNVTTWKNALFSGRRRVLCRPCYLQYFETR